MRRYCQDRYSYEINRRSDCRSKPCTPRFHKHIQCSSCESQAHKCPIDYSDQFFRILKIVRGETLCSADDYDVPVVGGVRASEWYGNTRSIWGIWLNARYVREIVEAAQHKKTQPCLFPLPLTLKIHFNILFFFFLCRWRQQWCFTWFRASAHLVLRAWRTVM